MLKSAIYFADLIFMITFAAGEASPALRSAGKNTKNPKLI
jgi:hypothetical protein